MVVYLHNHIQGYRKYFSKKINQLSEKIKLKGEKAMNTIINILIFTFFSIFMVSGKPQIEDFKINIKHQSEIVFNKLQIDDTINSNSGNLQDTSQSRNFLMSQSVEKMTNEINNFISQQQRIEK
jgi:hypothetical protein